MVKLMSSKRGW